MKMLIKEFAQLCDVSVRTLHYYDEIGLLKPAFVDETTGYRYYNEKSVVKMQEILFYRELDFSLKSITDIVSSENYDTKNALKEQKNLLILKKERLERLISAIDDAVKGENIMGEFDKSQYENYKSEVKERWGETAAYKEHTEKTKGYGADRWNELSEGLDDIFSEFALCMKNGNEADSGEAQSLVYVLKNYITANFYTCTNEILLGLSQMYVCDERFRSNIDKHADGTAQFVSEAIAFFNKI